MPEGEFFGIVSIVNKQANTGWIGGMENQEFKVRMTFSSLVSISCLIGFCAGVLSGVLSFFLSIFDPETPASFSLITLFAGPILGIVNGAFLGALAYPLYSWITKRVSFTYKGVLWTENEP